MRVQITIRGSICRPSYDGYVDVNLKLPADETEIKRAVVSKLNRTSFEVDKLRTSDIILRDVGFTSGW